MPAFAIDAPEGDIDAIFLFYILSKAPLHFPACPSHRSFFMAKTRLASAEVRAAAQLPHHVYDHFSAASPL